MAEDTTYNGWSNYPTWAVNLWLSNDEGLYRAVQGIAQSNFTDANEDMRVPAEEAANYVRDRITLRATALHIPKHSHVRIVRALPQNPTISDAIHRGEAGAL